MDEKKPVLEFTEGQKKVVAAGVTVLALAAVFAFAAFVVWACVRVLELTSAAIVPVLFGLFLSLFFKPYYGWFRSRLRNPTLAFFAMSATVLVPAGLIVWFAGSAIVDQVSNFLAAAPTLVAKISAWCQTNHPGWERGLRQLGAPESVLLFFTDPAAFSQEACAQLGAAYGGSAVKVGVGVAKSMLGLLNGIIAFVFFVYFLMKPDVKGADLANHLAFCKKDTRAFLAEQVDAFCDVMVNFFQRQVLICLVEGVLYGAGFALVGVPYGFLIGFGLGVFNLVPLFGTVVFLPVAVALAFFGDGGSTFRLVGTLVVWACGQVADGYCITPLIQGGKTGLGFAGVIFSFVFWGTVFHSMIGLLLAIPLSAFWLVLWRAVKKRYVRPVL